MPRMRERPPVLSQRGTHPCNRGLEGRVRLAVSPTLLLLLLLHSDRRPLPATQVLNGQAATRSRNTSDAQVVLSAVVEDKHQSSSDAAHHIGKETLVQARSQALFRRDLLEAVTSSLVQVLLHGFLRLHLQPTANRIEGISRASTDCDRCLCCGESACGSEDALVRLVGVEAC